MGLGFRVGFGGGYICFPNRRAPPIHLKYTGRKKERKIPVRKKERKIPVRKEERNIPVKKKERKTDTGKKERKKEIYTTLKLFPHFADGAFRAVVPEIRTYVYCRGRISWRRVRVRVRFRVRLGLGLGSLSIRVRIRSRIRL